MVRSGRLWTLTTIVHTVPFLAAAILLTALEPITAPVALILLVHAWVIPELYAARSGVARLPNRNCDPAERRAGLLGDLVDRDARDLHASTGWCSNAAPSASGSSARRARSWCGRGPSLCCSCVKVTDQAMPAGDRIAHLVLAVRSDEAAFATVANLAFCGASWRLRRHLPKPRREALDRGVLEARRT
ncbi:MAG: hypothetical protein ACR2ND_12575 [Solirubrobacteraceae bacterium]